MAEIAHPIEDFQTLIQPLIGLTVSLPWKGYGSAIFLELGRLAPLKPPRQRYNKGEACVFIEWDWRVESGSTVLYGSSNSGPKIDAGICALQGATIQSLAVVGQVPELMVYFSNGHCLRSMVMVTGDPRWSIRLEERRWLHAKASSVLISDGDEVASVTDQERAVWALEEQAAFRWGVPAVEPTGGLCRNCASFVPLDGEGELLDYGACISAVSPFDGRVVNQSGGCSAFSRKR